MRIGVLIQAKNLKHTSNYKNESKQTRIKEDIEIYVFLPIVRLDIIGLNFDFSCFILMEV